MPFTPKNWLDNNPATPWSAAAAIDLETRLAAYTDAEKTRAQTAEATEIARAEAAESALIPTSQKGQVNGVATLDSGGHIPVGQNSPSVVSVWSAAGHPTTGTWTTDQAVVDTNGDVWLCTAGGTPGTWIEGAAGGGGSNYQTLEVNSAAQTQRAKLNLIPGTGVTIANSDNPGANSSDVTISASGGGGSYDGLGSTFLNVKDAPYSAAGNGTTDDTAAIQAAIVAAVNAGGGTVYFPDGTYLVSGALKTVSPLGADGFTYCAQIIFPVANGAEVELVGNVRMNLESRGGPINGAKIVSNSAGQAYSVHSALPCVFGGPENFLGSISSSFSSIGVRLTNLEVVVPTNPQIAAINLAGIGWTRVSGVLCRTQDSPAFATQPTHKEGIGLLMPAFSNLGSQHLEDFDARGFYQGIVLGEHTIGTNVLSGPCYIGVGWTPMGHAAVIDYLDLEFCTYPLAFSDYTNAGGPVSMPGSKIAILQVAQADFESQGAGWQATIAHLSDLNAAVYGGIRYHDLTNTQFILNGTTFVKLETVDLVRDQVTRLKLSGSPNQTLTNGATTALNWTGSHLASNRVIYNYDGLGVWAAGNPTRLTAQSGGVYLVEWYVEFAGSAGGTTRSTTLKKTSPVFGSSEIGSQSGATATASYSGSSATQSAVGGSALVWLDPTDYVELTAYQDSGGNLDVIPGLAAPTHIAMVRVA